MLPILIIKWILNDFESYSTFNYNTWALSGSVHMKSFFFLNSFPACLFRSLFTFPKHFYHFHASPHSEGKGKNPFSSLDYSQNLFWSIITHYVPVCYISILGWWSTYDVWYYYLMPWFYLLLIFIYLDLFPFPDLKLTIHSLYFYGYLFAMVDYFSNNLVEWFVSRSSCRVHSTSPWFSVLDKVTLMWCPAFFCVPFFSLEYANLITGMCFFNASLCMVKPYCITMLNKRQSHMRIFPRASSLFVAVSYPFWASIVLCK